jgi:hypothetical protein
MGFIGDDNVKSSYSDVAIFSIRKSALGKPEVSLAISSILFASNYAQEGVIGFSIFPIVAEIIQDDNYINFYLHGPRRRLRDLFSPYVDECGAYFQKLLHGLFINLFAFARTNFMLTSLCLDTVMVAKATDECLLVLPLAIIESKYVNNSHLDHLYSDITGKKNSHSRCFALAMCQRILNGVAA